MNVLDLFSGIGGFSLGLERAGFETVAFCEIDPYCQKVLRKHWPHIPIHDDIRTLRGDEFGPVDVVCGGFPCQDISRAGPYVGLAGSRSGLWSEFARIIHTIRPRYVIVENVAALLEHGMGRILGDLAESGYDAEWDSICTGFPFGHRRERIFIVAHLVRERLSQWSITDENNSNAAGIFSRQRFAGFLVGVDPMEKWADRPLLERGISRVPERVGRVKSAGNAVVPQIPEMIGRAIMEAEGMPA